MQIEASIFLKYIDNEEEESVMHCGNEERHSRR